MPDAAGPRRGRPARPEPAEPTGYRCTAPIRLQLQLAIPFLGESNMQSVIDRAVKEFLARLRTDVQGFADAVEAAERNVTGAAANVRRLPRGR